MVVSCCALGCKERFTKGGAYTFHCFPKDEARRKLWEKQLRRGNFTSTPYSRICSKHFEEKYFQVEKFGGKWLKSDAVPTIFDFPPIQEEDEGEDIMEIPQDGEGNGEDQVKKKLRYIGDFDEKDMESPTKARKFLFVAKTEQKMKKNKIRRLRRRNQALQDEVTTLKEILNRMNSNSGSFYDVESISQVLAASTTRFLKILTIRCNSLPVFNI
ncbi:hypothetical protein TNCV_3276971 [Trichonephila clavipes]|nr:hypothetical protein TNCV_3276971 [Trichonephila clavipes]